MSGWISPYSAAQLAELEKSAREKRLAVEIDTATPLRYCTGPEDISYGGATYVAKDFTVSPLATAQDATIKFEGPTNELTTAKFTEGDFGGIAVDLHQFLRQDSGSWLHIGTRPFIAKNCSWNISSFVIYVKEETRVKLSKANTIVSSRCDLVSQFKGPLCQYAGGDTNCQGTFDDCKAKSNAAHFRGARMAPAADFRLQISWVQPIYILVGGPPEAEEPIPAPPVAPRMRRGPVRRLVPDGYVPRDRR